MSKRSTGERYKSDALAAVHETALGLHEAGVMDERTMKAFDEMCLTMEHPYSGSAGSVRNRTP